MIFAAICAALVVYCLAQFCIALFGKRGEKSAWFASVRVAAQDPLLIYFPYLSFAFFMVPFVLLYFAAFSAKTTGALAWIGIFLGSETPIAALPPFTRGTGLGVLLILGVVAAFGLAGYLLIRVMNCAAVHIVNRRLAAEPQATGTAAALVKHFPAIMSALLKFRRSAGVNGTFVPQYLMCRGEDASSAILHSAELVSRLGLPAGENKPSKILGMEFAQVRTTAELSGAFMVGIIPVAFLAEYLAIAAVPGDNFKFAMAVLFGTAIVYALAFFSLASLLDSVYLTAVFAKTSGSASPQLLCFESAHLARPFP